MFSHIHTSIFQKIKDTPNTTKIFGSTNFLILFWSIFDSIVSFFVPIYLVNHGFSKTQMGLIISTSSIFGAIFDFTLSKFLKNTHYRRLYAIVFMICFLFPSLLWSYHGILLVLIAMAAWGLYCDVQNFAIFDLVITHSETDKSCQNFAVIAIFKSLGYFFGPLIAGIVLYQSFNHLPMAFSLLFLSIAFIFYLLLVYFSRNDRRQPQETHRRVNFFKEFYLWKSIARILFPVLFFNTLIFMFDSVFWVLVPLFSELFSGFEDFNGLMMGFYMLPGILTTFFIGNLVVKFGKKRTAYISFLLANLFILPMAFLKAPIPFLIVVFISSFCGSFVYPAIRSAYADYMSESSTYESEIQGLNDFTTNLGYIFGPILAGFLSDKFGLAQSFTVFALMNIVFVIILLFITPKNIDVVIHRKSD